MSLRCVTGPAVEPVTMADVFAHCRIDETNREPAPTASTAALASPATPGNVTAGAHRYAVVFVTASGHTEAGAMSAPVTVEDATVNGQVTLTGVPIGGATVVARDIYRTAANGSTLFKAGTIADNVTTTYTDNVADASLGAQAPTWNTTSDPHLALLVAAARQHAEHLIGRRLISQTWELVLDAFPGAEIPLGETPTLGVDFVRYYDDAKVLRTIDPADYVVDADTEPGWILPRNGFRWPSTASVANAVTVRFRAGYGTSPADVPAGIRQWILLRVKTMFDARDQAQFASGSPILSTQYVDRMLDEFRRYA